MNCKKIVSRWPYIAMLLAAIAVLIAAKEAQAQAIFSREDTAQLHCPNDKVVWLDFAKRRYYTSGQKLYARGRTASFVCMKEAKRSGYKKSRLGRR